MWLCELLDSVGAISRSFSKYGNAYKRVLAEQGTVQIRKTDSGKVSVYRIPTAKQRAPRDDMLIAPSAGYEVENNPAPLVR